MLLSVLILLFIISAIVTHYFFWSFYYRRSEIHGELKEFIVDGQKRFVEYIPPKSKSANAPQVVCCPGLACNGRIFHFNKDISLALSLSKEGFGVWILHPRNMGANRRKQNSWIHPQKWNYGYQTYLNDSIEMTKHIVAHCQQPIHWVGHSMGGLIGLDLLNQEPQLIKSMILSGSPVDLRIHISKGKAHERLKFRQRFLFELKFLGRNAIRLNKIFSFLAPWAGWIRFLEQDFMNPKYLSGGLLRKAMVQIFEDVPRQLIEEFSDAMKGGDTLRGESFTIFSQKLKETKVKIYCMASKGDRLAPEASSKALMEWVKPEVLEYEALDDYGHFDIIFGEKAVTTIYPKIAHFIKEQA
jgi:pimeloyl-ACP methyl ester carboxylesterase